MGTNLQQVEKNHRDLLYSIMNIDNNILMIQYDKYHFNGNHYSTQMCQSNMLYTLQNVNMSNLSN